MTRPIEQKGGIRLEGAGRGMMKLRLKDWQRWLTTLVPFALLYAADSKSAVPSSASFLAGPLMFILFGVLFRHGHDHLHVRIRLGARPPR